MTPNEARGRLEPIAALAVESSHDWQAWLKAERRRAIARACLNFVTFFERRASARTATAAESAAEIETIYSDYMIELRLSPTLNVEGR